MDTVNDFLKKTYKVKELSEHYEFVEVRPRIVCNDGFSLSVQASDGMYCQPRVNCTEVTCGLDERKIK